MWGAGGDGRHLKHVYSTAFAVVLTTVHHVLMAHHMFFCMYSTADRSGDNRYAHCAHAPAPREINPKKKGFASRKNTH